MISVLSGLVAGGAHVLGGPDHLAAVAPFSAVANRKNAWAVGIRWGLGHSSGVLLIGILALILREMLPVEALSSWAERLVGVMLIAIGVFSLRKALSSHVHAHEHTHDGQTHLHIHVHGTGQSHRRSGSDHQHTHAAFAIGALHGLAGSSHFLGVLPALAFLTRWDAVGYLAAFAAGSIFAMGCFSSLIGFALRRFGSARAYTALMGSCSAAAFAVGFFWLAR